MSKQISSLNVALLATVAPFNNGLKAGEKAIAGFAGKVAEIGGKLIEMTGIAAIAGGAIGSVFELGKGFSLAAQFETANVQLTALTGSVNNAHILMGQLRDFAKSSPFEFPELLEASKKLMAVGVNADQITPLLKQVGEVAAGTGSDIGSVADIFVKVAAEGKVTSKELKEFGKEGIPEVQTLAAQFHTTAAGVAELADNGTIGFAQLQKAFQSMTGPGGRFNGILAAQSQTIGGVMHTMVDTVEEASAGVAESLLKAFDVTAWLPKITTAFDSVGKSISNGLDAAKPIITTFTDYAASAFGSLQSIASTAVGGISAFIRGNWTSILSDTVEVFTAVGGFFGAVWTGISDVAQAGATNVDGGMNLIATGAKWLADKVSFAFNVATYSFTHIGDVAQLVGTTIQLWMVQAYDKVKYIFGTAIPAVVFWLADNWQSAIVDLVNGTMQALGNMAQSVINIFSNLPDLIAGNVSFDSLWVPLSKGFQSQLKSWPEIAAQGFDPVEDALAKKVDGLNDRIGGGLGGFLAQQQTASDKAAKELGDKLKKIGTDFDAPHLKPLVFDATVNPSNLTVGITPEIRKAKAMLSGSAESLAARFNTPIVAAGAGGPIIPPVQPNGAGPIAANASTQPPAPRVAGTNGAASAASNAADKAHNDQLVIANQWLYKIELNTRTGFTGPTVVSI
jgi:hypothetical protein